jgi:hypothetical protein
MGEKCAIKKDVTEVLFSRINAFHVAFALIFQFF